MKAAGDHQVKDEEQLASDRRRILGSRHDNPLADAIEADDRLPFNRGQRRIDGSEQKGRREPDAENPLPDDARSQRVQVKKDVR